MKYKTILFKVQDKIATLTLNLPDVRNAISGSRIIEEIEIACRLVNNDPDAKVLIITAVGTAFSSGGNIKDMRDKKGMFAGSPSEIMENYRKSIQRIPIAVYGVEIPTIAAVNGPAIGAGCDLAMMCDIRVASKRAKFGETFLNVGLIPGDGGAYFLPRLVGMARACELTFTGQVIDAKQALEIGLVNHVTSHEDLMAKSLEIACSIASKPGPALKMAKQLLRMSASHSLPQILEQSAAFQAVCHHTEDHREALNAVFEKRDPNFKDK